jgi:hypothetical protein
LRQAFGVAAYVFRLVARNKAILTGFTLHHFVTNAIFGMDFPWGHPARCV